MREISKDEVSILEECVRALSAHHNEVSVNFKGAYPTRPCGKTLEMFAEALEVGTSRIAVIEAGGKLAGFCKADIADGHGKLDYLVVLSEYRGQGFGKVLMDWAMAAFAEAGADYIEVKVVDGNSAIRLYEKYGFKMNAHILRREVQRQI